MGQNDGLTQNVNQAIEDLAALEDEVGELELSPKSASNDWPFRDDGESMEKWWVGQVPHSRQTQKKIQETSGQEHVSGLFLSTMAFRLV